MYDVGTYGSVTQINGVDDIIAFQHTLDNRGPQTYEHVPGGL